MAVARKKEAAIIKRLSKKRTIESLDRRKGKFIKKDEMRRVTRSDAPDRPRNQSFLMGLY